MVVKALESSLHCEFENLKKLHLSHTGLNCYIEEDIKYYIESQLYCGILQRIDTFSVGFKDLKFLTSVCEEDTPSLSVHEKSYLYDCQEYLDQNLNNLDDSRSSMAYAEEESWCDADEDFIEATNASAQLLPDDMIEENWDTDDKDTVPSTYQLNHDLLELQINTQEQNTENTDDEREGANVDVKNEREFVLVKSHPHKVYISNINFKTPQYKLWQLMEGFGDVKFCKILKDHRRRSKGNTLLTRPKMPQDIEFVKNKFMDTATRRGFILFKELEAVQKILCATEEQLTLDKRVLKVEPALWKKYIPEESDASNSNKFKERKDRRKNSNAEPILESWDESDTNQDEVNCNANESSSTKNINDLNDYTLLHIFSYLPWNKRIQCERVCRKWKAISLKCWLTTTHLSLYGVLPSFTIFTEKMLRKLLKRDCTILQSLDLSSVSRMLGISSLETIGKQCPNLKSLDLSGMSTSNRSLKPLAEGCKYIEWLKLKDCHDINDKSLFSLFVNWKKLKYLNLEGNRRISGKCFHISQPHIQTLILTDCVQLSDEGILKIADRWNTLTTLHLNGCVDVSDEAFKTLTQKCSQIKIFQMMGHVNQLTPSGLRSLCNLSHLQELNVNTNPSVDDSVLTAISDGCKQLRKLDILLCWKEITDTGIRSLAGCPLLENLDIGYLIKPTDDSITHLATNGMLKSLTARGCSNINEAGFESVIVLCPNLQLLDVSGCINVSQNILQAFKREEHLLANELHKVELFIGGTAIEDEETGDLPDYLKVHFHNLCVNSLRPDREIFIYMGGDTDDDENVEDFDQNYDLADDYLDYDDPLFEERFNPT